MPIIKETEYKAKITQENGKTQIYHSPTSIAFQASLGTHETSFKKADVNHKPYQTK
jgi:hypothetical protein